MNFVATLSPSPNLRLTVDLSFDEPTTDETIGNDVGERVKIMKINRWKTGAGLRESFRLKKRCTPVAVRSVMWEKIEKIIEITPSNKNKMYYSRCIETFLASKQTNIGQIKFGAKQSITQIRPHYSTNASNLYVRLSFVHYEMTDQRISLSLHWPSYLTVWLMNNQLW